MNEFSKSDKPVEKYKSDFMFLAFAPWYATPGKTQREEARQNILKTVLPDFLKQFERVNKIREGPFLLGYHLSYADFYLASFMDVLGADIFIGPNLLDSYPELRQHKKDVLAIPQIKEQLQKHPMASPCCTQCQKYVLADK